MLASTSSSSHSESISRMFVSCFDKDQHSVCACPAHAEIAYLDVVASLGSTRQSLGILDGNRGTVWGDGGALGCGALCRVVQKRRERSLRRRRDQYCVRSRSLRGGKYLPRREPHRRYLRPKRAGCLDTLESGGSQTHIPTGGERGAQGPRKESDG